MIPPAIAPKRINDKITAAGNSEKGKNIILIPPPAKNPGGNPLNHPIRFPTFSDALINDIDFLCCNKSTTSSFSVSVRFSLKYFLERSINLLFVSTFTNFFNSSSFGTLDSKNT